MHPHRILIVDDDADIRESLADVLELEGFSVVCAANGREALDYLARSEPPCMILLDLMMPIMDGWQFLVEQRRDPSIARIPVVVISAATPEQTKTVVVERIVRKPLRLEDVLDSVQQHC